MATSVIQKVTKKLIAVLTAVTAVNTPTGGRIYGAHIATIQDPVYPAISMHVLEGSRLADGAFNEVFILQIDLWFKAAGKSPAVWDDVLGVWAAVLEALHANSFFDSEVKIMKVMNVSQGPMLHEYDTGILHFPGRFQIMATTP